MVTSAMKVNAREAARLLSVSESELYRWVDEGEVPFLFVNHQPFFNRDELLEWATDRRLTLAPELFADEGQHAKLAPALEHGGVHYHVRGTELASTLAAVIDCLPIDDPDERAAIHEIMLARGEDCAASIGGGIAIPHVRSPLVFAGRPPAIALCFLETALPFTTRDGELVTTMFATMTPTVTGHLQLLSHLSRALHDTGFVAALQQRAERATILAEARRVDSQLEAS